MAAPNARVARSDDARTMTATCPDPEPAAPVHDALRLTAGGATALIRLHDQTWTLRITRQGKLILTK
jgi:hemin uptake protein HemP